MLYSKPVLPSSVCCLLILSPQRHLLVIKKKIIKILLHGASMFPSGMAGLGELGVQLWGRLVLRMLWLLWHIELWSNAIRLL